MINLLTGLQGSGKTYYAVAEIWKHIKKMHQAEISGTDYKYKKIYTNIEGFTPNRYVETLDVSRLYEIQRWELEQYKAYEARNAYHAPDNIDFTPAVRHKHIHDDIPILNIELDETRVEESTVDNIEIFDNNDTKLFESIKDPNASLDPEFIHFTMPEFEKQGFTHCLIVIDEAHNFFGGGGLKPAFKRLLSYHRHYHDQDYLLISQDTKMFNAAVSQLTAYTINAVNPIMRWRSDIFTYNVYSGGWISYSGDNKLETKTLKAKELIFTLYNSGGKKLAKSFFFKIIMRLLFGILAVVAYGYYSMNNFTESKEPKKVIKKENNVTKPAIIKKVEIVKKKNIEIFLIIQDSIIHQKTGKKFILDSFYNLLDYDDKVLSKTDNLDFTTKVYYELSDNTMHRLDIKGKEDENTNNYYRNF